MQVNSLKNNIYILLNASLIILAIIILNTDFIVSSIGFVLLVISIALSYTLKAKDYKYGQLIKISSYLLAYTIFTTLINYSIVYAPNIEDVKQVPCLITCNKQFKCEILMCDITKAAVENNLNIHFSEVLIILFIKTTLLFIASIISIYYTVLTFIFFISALRAALKNKKDVNKSTFKS
jgi:hypothetical protein